MALTTVLVGLVVASAAASAYQQIQAGAAANQAAQMNANIVKRNAEIQEAEAEIVARQEEANAAASRQDAAYLDELMTYEMARLGERASARQASMRAAIGASGVGFEGSPRDILDEDERQLGIEASLVRFRTESEQRALRMEAAQSEFAARQARETGRFALAAGRNRRRLQQFAGQQALRESYWNAGGEVLGGATGITQSFLQRR